MKTVVLAGLDNLVFSAADMLNPKELKLIGFATTIEEAWNIYDENGNVIEVIEQMPIMPIEAAVGLEPDIIILAASNEHEDDSLKYMLYRANYRGDVISLFDFYKGFSQKLSAIRKMIWRLEDLGVPGAVGNFGKKHGDIAWQLEALMPDRKSYRFHTVEEFENNEEERYAFVHIDTGVYDSTYTGIQYFFPRMNKGGMIIVSAYEDGKNAEVRQAIYNLEAKYGAFLITPIGDIEGTIVISRP